MNGELNTLADTDASTEAVRIERPTLHNVVVTRIRDMIIEGRIPVGARIHEGQLCQQLGISRTPLREALKVLASEGLVDLVPSRGAMVRKLTRKDARDMLDVLSHLEAMAGPLTCQNATDEEIREVRSLHDQMLEFYKTRERLPYFKLNQQCLVHDILQTRMKRIRFIGDQKEESLLAAVRDHEEMMEALEARDGERLSAAMVNHLRGTWERIKNAI